jgi:MFS transporter, ACS family, hexuronate transporter
LLSVAIAISYLDRQALSVAVAAIQRDIPLTNVQFSHLQVAFLLAYAVMYAGGGALVDRLGTRRGLLVIMIAWSLATATHGLATGFRSLLVSRFLLGMGEGGGFPAATKAVSEWFPASERSTAMGIINAGTAVGAVVAPPAIAAILGVASWRWVFFATGATGFIWAIWWMRAYVTPEATATAVEADAVMPWTRLLGFREVWGLIVAKFLSDAAWYFYLFWLPKYLYDVRGFDVKRVGAYAWIPYAAAGVGCLVGGWLSSWLLTRDVPLDRARKIALGLSAAVMPAVMFVPGAPVAWALAIFSLAYFGQQSWSTLVMVLPADIYPRGAVGAVAGLVGFGGAMGGVVFGQVVGVLLDAGFGYGLVFTLAGSFHVIAFAVLCLAIPVVRPIAVPVPRLA